MTSRTLRGGRNVKENPLTFPPGFLAHFHPLRNKLLLFKSFALKRNKLIVTCIYIGNCFGLNTEVFNNPTRIICMSRSMEILFYSKVGFCAILLRIRERKTIALSIVSARFIGSWPTSLWDFFFSSGQTLRVITV